VLVTPLPLLTTDFSSKMGNSENKKMSVTTFPELGVCCIFGNVWYGMVSDHIFPEKDPEKYPHHQDFLSLVREVNAKTRLVKQDPLYKKKSLRHTIVKCTAGLIILAILIFSLLQGSMPPIIFAFFACNFFVILAVIISFALPKPSKMIEEATYPLIHAWNQSHREQSILYKPQRMKWCRKIEIKPAKLELQK